MVADEHQDVPQESNHDVTTESHQSVTHDSHHTSHHNVTPWRGDRKEEANSQDLEGSFSLKTNTGISDFTFKVRFNYIFTIKSRMNIEKVMRLDF